MIDWQVNQLMARADVDHNGKLDLTEFTLMMHNYRQETRDKDLEEFRRREEIMQAFRAFDKHGEDRIAIEDVKLFLRHFGVSETEVLEFICKFDENKNGYFEIEEFLKFMSCIQY